MPLTLPVWSFSRNIIFLIHTNETRLSKLYQVLKNEKRTRKTRTLVLQRIQIKFNMFCNFHEMCYQFYERYNFKPFLTKQLLNVFKIWYEWGHNLIAKTDQITSGVSIFYNVINSIWNSRSYL